VRSNPLNSGPGFDIGVDYDPDTAVFNGVWCDNTGPYTIDCTANLVDGTTHQYVIGIGVGQLLDPPPDVGTVTVDAAGDLVFTNFRGFSVSPHL